MIIKDESYYVIQGWMRTQLGLRGNDLAVYALLWSFSQDGLSEYKGTIKYIADFIGTDRRTVQRVLERLINMTLVECEYLNDTNGRTNGYKCVPLEMIDMEKVGATNCRTPQGESVVNDIEKNGEANENSEDLLLETLERRCDNLSPPCDNLSYPCDNLSHPPSLYKENNIYNNTYKKESKKYIKDNINNTGACAREIPNFSKMSDEELMTFGETHIPDYTNEFECELFDAYLEEVEKRKLKSETWKGKVVRFGKGFERLKSHAEIMEENGVSKALVEALKEYLRFCYVNNRLVTNDQLERLIFDLNEKYGEDEEAKVYLIEKALSLRWFGIVV